MFTRYGKCRRPQHCRCLEACGVPYRMGVNDAHNTERKMSAPTTLFVLGRLQSTVSAGVQGMIPGIVVRLVCLALLSLFVPCPFLGGRPRSVGPSRL